MTPTFLPVEQLRLDEDKWLYLHSGGALGAGGPVSSISVELTGKIAHFRLVLPANDEELVAAIRASLRTTLICRPTIMFPVLAAAYRASMGRPISVYG